MKRYAKMLLLMFVLVVMIIYLTGCTKQTDQETDETIQITTTFYPIYTIAINLIEGTKGVEVSNLTSKDVGCIHDYTMSTSDLRKLEKTDILIENGLGLENFIDKVTATYQTMKIINASEEITDLVKIGDEINGHVWTSIEQYSHQIRTVSKKLQEYDTKNAEIYRKNEEEYITKLQELKNEYKAIMKIIEHEGVVILNESFVYLAKEINLDMTVLETDHEESTISAEKMAETIQTVEEKQIRMIWIDEKDSIKNAETIKKEVRTNICKLDSILSGDGSKDSYLNAMRNNFDIIRSAMIQR